MIIIFLYQNEALKMRLIFASLVLLAFIATRASIDNYFERKFAQTINFVSKLDVPIAPKLRTSHIVWHPIWLGLGDFDTKFGIEWRDQFAIDYVEPLMLRDGTLDYSQTGPDANILDIPIYDQYIREDFLSKLKEAPSWYLSILGKRLVRNTMDVVPVQIAVLSFSLRIFNFGAITLILLVFLGVLKEWGYFKLIIVTGPLAFAAMLVYSGSGMTYVNVHQQVSSAIIVGLIWDWLEKSRKESGENNIIQKQI